MIVKRLLLVGALALGAASAGAAHAQGIPLVNPSPPSVPPLTRAPEARGGAPAAREAGPRAERPAPAAQKKQKQKEKQRQRCARPAGPSCV